MTSPEEGGRDEEHPPLLSTYCAPGTRSGSVHAVAPLLTAPPTHRPCSEDPGTAGDLMGGEPPTGVLGTKAAALHDTALAAHRPV